MDLHVEKNFIKRCHDSLPVMLMVDGIKYKLDAHGLLAGSYRISYGEFDGDFFNWKNKPIDLFYELAKKVEISPKRNGQIACGIIYKTNMDEIISDCLDRLNTWHKGAYIELKAIHSAKDRNTLFERELTSLINRYSKENDSNTPDFMLAQYLTGCLNHFNAIVNMREKWYGREPKPTISKEELVEVLTPKK